jgi:hypothetical protein
MNRLKSILLAGCLLIGAVLFTGCKDDDKTVKTVDMQMTMTTEKSGDVTIYIAGSGAMMIDWGDGTPGEMFTLTDYNLENWMSKEYIYVHDFSNTSAHTITITGKNITHLRCSNEQLTNLDVSKNPALRDLDCNNNQLTGLDMRKNTVLLSLNCLGNSLTSLDVSKNTALTYLHVSWNQLTSLDVRKNKKLTGLFFGANELTSLDVSENKALIHLDCSYNQFSVDALNALMGTLSTHNAFKIIWIGNNPGTDACDQSIAKDKGWNVYTSW